VQGNDQDEVRRHNQDELRRHNLSRILRIVHRAGPASRSELTRATGLNRSTIAALVGALVSQGLVVERGSESRTGVGRPSPTVVVDETFVALAVYPEVDAVTVGLVGLNGVVRRRIVCPVERPPSAAEAVNIATAVIDGMRGELEASFQVAGIGVAIPGLVRASDGLVHHAPSLGWVEEPFAARLAKATGYSVWAANDASLGAGAERYFGAGRGLTDLIYLNGGAGGIGGGLVVGGFATGGAVGFAGEFGHMRVSADESIDSAGLSGTLEAEVTKAALLRVLGLERADTDELERALLESDSPIVAAEVQRQLKYLAVALSAAINILNPQAIVLGGFLAALLAKDPGGLQKLIAARTLAAPFGEVQLKPAQLGVDLFMIGAAELAFAHRLDDPTGPNKLQA
jgi:predicted NBD/HSP70 family sugar kinase